MRTVDLVFPTGRYSLEAPEEVLAATRVLYPHSLASRDPAAADLPALFRVERRGGHWHLEREGASLGEFSRPLHVALALEHGIETRIVRDCGEWIAFHAGAVGVGDGAVLLAGLPDSGKTSCTFQLVELGHRFVAEEVALVEPGSRRVHPYLQTPALDDRFLREFERTRPVAAGRVEKLDHGLRRYLPARVARQPLPLEAILLPRYRPRQEPAVEELEASAVLTEILAYCFEPNGDDEAFFERVIALVGSVRLLRLAYPHAAGARELLAGLFPPPGD